MEHQASPGSSPSNIRPPLLPRITLTPTPRNPEVVQFAYTADSIWRNRDTFLQGRDQIVDFLRKKWAREHGYRLRKELFAFTDNKVCFIAFCVPRILLTAIPGFDEGRTG